MLGTSAEVYVYKASNLLRRLLVLIRHQGIDVMGLAFGSLKSVCVAAVCIRCFFVRCYLFLGYWDRRRYEQIHIILSIRFHSNCILINNCARIKQSCSLLIQCWSYDFRMTTHVFFLHMKSSWYISTDEFNRDV